VNFIIEFRRRGKYEDQEEKKSNKNPKNEATFGTFQSSVTIRYKERARTLDHYLFA
jgi:hypothetical protein